MRRRFQCSSKSQKGTKGLVVKSRARARNPRVMASDAEMVRSMEKSPRHLWVAWTNAQSRGAQRELRSHKVEAWCNDDLHTATAWCDSLEKFLEEILKTQTERPHLGLWNRTEHPCVQTTVVAHFDLRKFRRAQDRMLEVTPNCSRRNIFPSAFIFCTTLHCVTKEQ